MASSESFDVAERFGVIEISQCPTCRTRSELIQALYQQLDTQSTRLAWTLGFLVFFVCLSALLVVTR